jgi:hypothetical protein
MTTTARVSNNLAICIRNSCCGSHTYSQILLDSLAVVVIHIAKLLDTFTVVIIHIHKLLDNLAVVVYDYHSERVSNKIWLYV